ncbi:DUF2059 domain-containing protein [Shewanella eurypsychrophilus]|uniref:DUF2059 domain-containing protein n=1 Tax=Shewanella eurypsychrophilus TaxID=2593656 RepID=A0ABX6V9F9_9GAMM|nr:MULTISPECIES: DUF2059 domain-containing protein [Shewanella]QFU24105.1 DUF2059 domain-containing protein [Shewanella sp. YLB-09]QPG59313.1 DUF2059 domain-containing protein [Shewanella eurypsychrophilus]
MKQLTLGLPFTTFIKLQNPLKPLRYFLSLLLIASALLVNFTVSADEDSRRYDVEQLLIEMKTESMIDTMYDQVTQMMLGMKQQLKVKESEQEMFETFMLKSTEIMRQELGWAQLKQPMIDLYAKHYSEKELADMIAFYRSESGRSMVEKMPLVMQESMIMTQALAQPMMIKMQSLSVEFNQELQAYREANTSEEVAD